MSKLFCNKTLGEEHADRIYAYCHRRKKRSRPKIESIFIPQHSASNQIVSIVEDISTDTPWIYEFTCSDCRSRDLNKSLLSLVCRFLPK